MGNRIVRLVFLGLVLAFPLLAAAFSPATPGRPASFRRSAGTVAGVELMVVLSLVHAARERVRLLAGRPAEIRRRPLPVRPHAPFLSGSGSLAVPKGGTSPV